MLLLLRCGEARVKFRDSAHIPSPQIGSQWLHDSAPPLALRIGLERSEQIVRRLAIQHWDKILRGN